MTKWAFLVVCLYIALVVVILLPVVLWAADLIAGQKPDPGEWFDQYLELYEPQEFDFDIFKDGYSGFWQFWLFFDIVVLIQASLLLIPVKIAMHAPQPQRHILIPAVATAFAFSIVLIAIIWSILAAIFGDNIPGLVLWLSLGFILLNWAFWSFVFYRFARNAEPKDFVSRLTKWLLRGSIAELLVAVPSHIIVRHKDVCCAQGFTFFGIAAGLVIMALAFGPGLFFLFLQRLEKSKPRSKRKDPLGA